MAVCPPFGYCECECDSAKGAGRSIGFQTRKDKKGGVFL